MINFLSQIGEVTLEKIMVSWAFSVHILYPELPVLAITATASQADMKAIQDSLGLKKCMFVVANPDRANIMYTKLFRYGQDVDAIKAILVPVANGLLQLKIQYPLTIVYIPLKLCGFAYKLFEHVLGDKQYFPPGSSKIPANRVFAQTSQMKDEILKQLCSAVCEKISFLSQRKIPRI